MNRASDGICEVERVRPGVAAGSRSAVRLRVWDPTWNPKSSFSPRREKGKLRAGGCDGCRAADDESGERLSGPPRDGGRDRLRSLKALMNPTDWRSAELVPEDCMAQAIKLRRANKIAA